MEKKKIIKLSIIVPVYCVEPYIEKCIASLLVDGYYNYEIVVVNDGTKDRSIEIVRDKFNDSRIRIIEQANGGLSAARNFGIAEAKGEYIWCVDSDDWVETEEIPQMMSLLDGIDALYFGSYYADDEDGKQSQIIHLNNQGETGKELASSSFAHCAPYYVIKRSVILENRHYFKEGILHEDSLFTPIFVLLCDKVKRFDYPVYHHLQREGSITQTINPKRIYDLIFVTSNLLEYGNGVDVAIRYRWGRCIAQIVNGLLSCSQKCDDKDARNKTRRFVNSHPELLAYLGHSSINNRIMSLMAKLLCGNLFFAHSILYKFHKKS